MPDQSDQDLPITAYFFDGPWAGVEVPLSEPATKILVVGESGHLLRYEADEETIWPDKKDRRFVLTRDEEEFDYELVPLLQEA